MWLSEMILVISGIGFLLSVVVLVFGLNSKKFWWFFSILFSLILVDMVYGMSGIMLAVLVGILLVLSKFWRFGGEFWGLQLLSVVFVFLVYLGGDSDNLVRGTFLYFLCFGLLMEEVFAHSHQYKINPEVRVILDWFCGIFFMRFFIRKVRRFMELID